MSRDHYPLSWRGLSRLRRRDAAAWLDRQVAEARTRTGLYAIRLRVGGAVDGQRAIDYLAARYAGIVDTTIHPGDPQLVLVCLRQAS